MEVKPTNNAAEVYNDTIPLDIPLDVYEKIDLAASIMNVSIEDFILNSVSTYIEELLEGQGYGFVRKEAQEDMESVLNAINELQ